MSAQSSLVLNDGQSTPVAKTFSARGADMQLAVWKDIASGISIGFPTVTLSNKERNGSNGTYRVEARVTLPVLETISGDAGGYTPSPKVAYTMLGKVELISPNRATVQNRKDLRAFVANLMGNTILVEAFVDYNPPN
jgi:hypothetical protein